MAEVASDLGDQIARHPSLAPYVEALAARVLGAAEGLAADHVKTGEFVSHLSIEPDPGSASGVDLLVVAADPNVLSIEYGHFAHHADGSSTFVEGQHIMTRAADSVAE